MAKKMQFDFILCDLNMPIMNGYECAKKIKSFYNQKNLFFESEVELFCPYLVACSACITPSIHKKAKDCGFDEVFE